MDKLSKEAVIGAAALALTLLTTITGSVWNLRSYLEERDAAVSLELAAVQTQLKLVEFRLAQLEEGGGKNAP